MYCSLIDSISKHTNFFYLPNNMPVPVPVPVPMPIPIPMTMGMAWKYLMGCFVVLTVKGINKPLITESEAVFARRRLNKC